MNFAKKLKKIMTGIATAALVMSSMTACDLISEVPIIQTPSNFEDIETTTPAPVTTPVTPTETSPLETSTTDVTDTTTKDSETTTPAETTTDETTTSGQVIPSDGKVKSYLTGKWVDASIGMRRPVAVVLSNIITAVPQSGIEYADVVFETPVEGGITRLIGIFENYDALKKIGSVRSARLYHVYIALEFDAVFAHFGSAVYADKLLAESFVHNLSGLAGESSLTYYRTDDRKAPHNAYSSGEGITKGIAYKKYRTGYDENYSGHFKFAEDGVKVEPTDGVAATLVKPGYNNNSPWFEYNAEDGKYYRFQFENKQIDAETNNQLAYDNIIFQVVDYYDYGDGYYYIYNQGSGAGKYITGGKCIDITWTKDEEFGITKYYTLAGEELTINQGKTWISLIFDTNVNKIIVE